MKCPALAFVFAVPALAAAQPGPALKAKLPDLAWISGHWANDEGGTLSEEVWTAPAGDSMLGMWRFVAGSKVKVLEILTLTEADEGVTLRLRHFDPRLVGREDKERAVELKLVRLQGREAEFEGAAYSGEGRVRLTYRRVDDQSLAVTLDKGGKKEEFSFKKRRAQP
jgi:hypothetical protein